VLPEQTLVIAISQSGETFDTIAAARAAKERGAKVLAICNRRSSTLTRDADATILLRAGPEISVCSTKAFTSQLTVLFLFALLMGRLRGLPLDEGALLLQELQELPRHVEALLLRREEIQKIARKYGRYADFFFLGRHYMFPTALESALKLKEISYLHATGYPAGEMKHGPIALVDPELAIVGLCGNAHTLDKMLSNLAEMKARGAPLLLLAPATCAAAASLADDWIPLPELPDALAPVLYTIACQLLSYFIALEKGTDIDQPRNLAKSVTVE
jgi:glucosamine--fructose-6-phosphate aminotransferase (isomerizing)